MMLDQVRSALFVVGLCCALGVPGWVIASAESPGEGNRGVQSPVMRDGEEMEEQDPDTFPDLDAPNARGADEAAIARGRLGCQRVFLDGAPVIPAGWGSGTPGGLPRPAGFPEIYDDCEPQDFTLTDCSLRRSWGKRFCNNGHWTILCDRDSQCPDSMRCHWGGTGVGTLPSSESYGWCAKSCNVVGTPGDCFRPDLACDAESHVCRVKRNTDEVTEGPCVKGEPGLWIRLAFDAPECGVPEGFVSVDIAGMATREAPQEGLDLRIPWPEGVQGGTAGKVKYRATGEGLVATGTAEFVARPTSCVVVEIPARCKILGGGVNSR